MQIIKTFKRYIGKNLKKTIQLTNQEHCLQIVQIIKKLESKKLSIAAILKTYIE